MKILMINSVCGIRSTGRICTDLAASLEKRGHTVKIAYGRENVPEQFSKYAVKIGNNWDVKIHGIKARLFDTSGFESKKVTRKFVNWIKKFDPDIIHIHNLHGYYINIEVLFDYLKQSNKRIIWTLHDCWNFTGHCSYFTYVNCNKWKNGCCSCLQKKEYPKAWIFDNSRRNYFKKKYIFTEVQNMKIVTPSKWLANLLKESFLSSYPVYVIPNGVDTTVFRYEESDLKKIYNLEDKKIILGIAAVWNKRKGLDAFIELAKQIEDEYRIILIGVTKDIIKKLPQNIIGIEKTDSVKTLAQFYSIADIFFNPTLEDNYPTTNIEALACDTFVITYNTGGSPESAKLNGEVVEVGDIKSVIEIIKNINNKKVQTKYIDKNTTVERYLELYDID